jgi:hypothetical protein
VLFGGGRFLAEEGVFECHGAGVGSIGVKDGDVGADVADVGECKAAEFGHVVLMEMKVLVVGFICHGAISRGGNEIKLFGHVVGVSVEDFNDEFTGPMKKLFVNPDFDDGGMDFIRAFANGDAVRDKLDFEVDISLLDGVLDNTVNNVLAMEVWMHHRDEPGGGDVEGFAKAMITKEKVVPLNPSVESGVELKVTECPVTLEMYEDAASLGLFVVPARSILETTEILADGVVKRKISGLTKSRRRRRSINGENGVGGVYFL